MLIKIPLDYPDLIVTVITGLVAILSAAVTLIVTHYLRNAGKVKIGLASWEEEFKKIDDCGGQEPAEKISDSQWVYFLIILNFWNPSESPKSLQGLKMEVKRQENGGNKILLPLKRFKASSNEKMVYLSQYQEFSMINLPSKQTVQEEVHLFVPQEEISFFSGTLNFYLIGTYPNGRKFKTFLLKSDY